MRIAPDDGLDVNCAQKPDVIIAITSLAVLAIQKARLTNPRRDAI